MIKTKRGNVKMRGNINELMADLTMAVHALYYEVLYLELPDEEAKKLVRDAVNLGLMTEEEVAENMLKTIAKKLSDLVSADNDESEEGKEDE